MIGRNTSLGKLDSKNAPIAAPSIPGNTRARNRVGLMLPKAWCETPETPDVTHSAMCTVALAAAGATPTDRSRLVAVTQKAMPKAPSMSCAMKPTAT